MIRVDFGHGLAKPMNKLFECQLIILSTSQLTGYKLIHQNPSFTTQSAKYDENISFAVRRPGHHGGLQTV